MSEVAQPEGDRHDIELRVGEGQAQRIAPGQLDAPGAAGVLLDTAVKDGATLFSVLAEPALREWVAAARSAGMLAALAGSLDESGVAAAGALGADVVGVRGSACDGGRGGRMSAERVRRLAAAVLGAAAASA